MISSGTGIADRRETAHSATDALARVLHLMKLRRPNLTIEDELGARLSFFQLKEQALLEKRQDSAPRS